MRIRSLFLVLWCERDGVSESSESEIKSGGFIIAVIIVLVTVPKKSKTKSRNKRDLFLKNFLNSKGAI